MISKLCFIAFGATILTLLAGVDADACSELRTCKENIFSRVPDGTFRFAFANSRPATISGWNNIWLPSCNNLENRITCANAETTCSNETLQNEVDFEKRKAQTMCTPDGRTFLTRVYEESPCTGNLADSQSVFARFATCKARHEYQIRSNMSNARICRLVRRTRNCDRRFVRRRCGNLFNWFIDIMWVNRAESFYPHCVNRLQNDRHPLPPTQAQACSDLRTCKTDIRERVPDGTFRFAHALSRPATCSEWNNIWLPSCTNLTERIACAVTTCENATLQKEVDWEKRKGQVMCTPDGQTFLERIYEESVCAGNGTATYLAQNNLNACRALHENTITNSTPNDEICNIVRATRNCDRNYIRNMCGTLFNWLIDRLWVAKAQSFYPHCVSVLESDQHALPPRPAS